LLQQSSTAEQATHKRGFCTTEVSLHSSSNLHSSIHHNKLSRRCSKDQQLPVKCWLLLEERLPVTLLGTVESVSAAMKQLVVGTKGSMEALSKAGSRPYSSAALSEQCMHQAQQCCIPQATQHDNSESTGAIQLAQQHQTTNIEQQQQQLQQPSSQHREQLHPVFQQELLGTISGAPTATCPDPILPKPDFDQQPQHVAGTITACGSNNLE